MRGRIQIRDLEGTRGHGISRFFRLNSGKVGRLDERTAHYVITKLLFNHQRSTSLDILKS